MLWLSRFPRKKRTSVGSQKPDGRGVKRAERLSDSAGSAAAVQSGVSQRPRRGPMSAREQMGSGLPGGGDSTCRGQQQAWLSEEQKGAVVM